MSHRAVAEPSASAGGSSACPLIGLAHGSRHAGLAPSIDRLIAATSALGQLPAHAAYLDLAQPDLTSVARDLAAAGHRRAVVTPLLFTEAFHARVDVPQAVDQAAEASGLELVTSDILGTGDDLLRVVQEGMRRAGIGDHESVLLVSVGSSNVQANEAVYDFAARLSSGRRATVAAAFSTRSPRADDVLAQLAPPIAIVPLFLSPGLLLDPLVELAAQRGLTIAPPLEALAAPVLVDRYRQVVSASGRPVQPSPVSVGHHGH